MKRTAWLAAVVFGPFALVIGCFSTPQPNCAFRCGVDNECPSGYACGPSDSVCHLVVNDTLADCEVQVTPDSPPVSSIDAPPAVQRDAPISVPDSPIRLPDAPPPSPPDAPAPSPPDAPPPSPPDAPAPSPPDAPPPSPPDAPAQTIDAGP